MYRGGTGDFFVLLFKSGTKATFKMVIDCGCINGGKDTFAPLVKDMAALTEGIVDVLVVTHEHADHINGFEKAAELFQTVTIKKVWMAWTENTNDPLANDLRKNHAKTKMALAEAVGRLRALADEGYFENVFDQSAFKKVLLDGTRFFLNGLGELQSLNEGLPSPLSLDANQLSTMEDFLRENKIIKPATPVEFLEPGELLEKIPGATGIRFYVLGPPKSISGLSLEEKKGENFEKREKPSSTDFAFTDALAPEETAALPFEQDHEWAAADDILQPDQTETLKMTYDNPDNAWRKIDHDWLFSAGNLALRFEKSINNTSLALALQFIDSERVLLFPGDAELGNWLSWHDENLSWNIKQGDETKTVNATYLLENTVFYKVGHHLSQNGTAKGKGLDLMKSSDLSAMATLAFNKILSGWLNTMPNDLLSAELIRKTKGKLYFVGDRNKIIENIQTDRTAISQTHLDTLHKLNKPFDSKIFIEVVVPARL